jgi:hypothetical protein
VFQPVYVHALWLGDEFQKLFLTEYSSKKSATPILARLAVLLMFVQDYTSLRPRQKCSAARGANERV